MTPAPYTKDQLVEQPTIQKPFQTAEDIFCYRYKNKLVDQKEIKGEDLKKVRF